MADLKPGSVSLRIAGTPGILTWAKNGEYANWQCACGHHRYTSCLCLACKASVKDKPLLWFERMEEALGERACKCAMTGTLGRLGIK